MITGIGKARRDTKLRTRPNEGEPWRPIALQMQKHGWPGRLVTIDGIDGSGKSTLLREIARQLEALGGRMIQTKTPSDDVRNMLLWRAWHDHTLGIPQSEIHEFGLTVISLGDKLLHQRRVIQKHLMAGDWVVSDRYILSSLAFESGVVHEAIGNLHIQPDLAFVVDVDPEVGMRRVRERGGEVEHPDDARVARETRERLLLLARANPLNLHVTDTTDKTPEQTFQDCLPHLQALHTRA